jgi:hypothetical protein
MEIFLQVLELFDNALKTHGNLMADNSSDRPG